jgi:hypothetical protein
MRARATRLRERLGILSVGLGALAIAALAVALITELVAGPFDKCPSPIYTTGQNVVFSALFGSLALSIAALIVAAYGKALRRNRWALLIVYSVTIAEFAAVIALYATHPAFECP